MRYQNLLLISFGSISVVYGMRVPDWLWRKSAVESGHVNGQPTVEMSQEKWDPQNYPQVSPYSDASPPLPASSTHIHNKDEGSSSDSEVNRQNKLALEVGHDELDHDEEGLENKATRKGLGVSGRMVKHWGGHATDAVMLASFLFPTAAASVFYAFLRIAESETRECLNFV